MLIKILNGAFIICNKSYAHSATTTTKKEEKHGAALKILIYYSIKWLCGKIFKHLPSLNNKIDINTQ